MSLPVPRSLPPGLTRLALPAFLALFLCLPLSPLLAQQETVVEINAVGGLRFDPARFAVEPGAKVKLVIENTDDMAHNFVLLKPGTRPQIVEAANVMPITPNADFIPKSDHVLQHSPLLNPAKSATLSFTAPLEEGVYPYVCTFPGHGLIMYGAMYVTKKALPPIATDTNLPETVREAGEVKKLHAYTATPPYLYRNFLRDSGPASIAVTLPGGQNYCWDAGACRLRYAWSGAFLDPSPHWAGNGDAFAEVKGRIYFRTPPGFPWHLGSRGKTPATVKFLGYRLVQRFPEFHYTFDGMDVRELIKPLHHGSGLETTFTIGASVAPLLYTFDPKGGAALTANAGTIQDGLLTLPPGPARTFTVTMTEVPGREPFRYWSMNDTFNGKKAGLVESGVQGRAASFDGAKNQIDLGVNTDQLGADATFAVWVKAQPLKGKQKKDSVAAPAEQVVLGAIAGPQYFLLGWNLAGSPGFGLIAGTNKESPEARIATEQPPDATWHHLAFTWSSGTYTLYCDGQKIGTAKGALPAKANLFLGSAGGSKFASAQMDEARLDDRAYSPAEIAALYQRERPEAATSPVQ